MSTESLISSGLEDTEEGVSPPPAKMGSVKAIITVCGVGLIGLVVGLSTGFLWSSLFNGILRKELILAPSSRSYALWNETPIPMYLKIYLFNWTNADDFHVGSSTKPNFVETGPYVFKEVDSKVNKIWNPNNGTVTFNQKRVWHFVESMSNGSLSDKITNLNPVATTIAYMMRYKIEVFKMMIDLAMKSTHEKLTVTKTVRELMFDGYEDELMKWATKLNSSLIPFDKFGWFYARNNSAPYDGIYNMQTGSEDFRNLGIVEQWNYSNKSKFHSPTCGSISGTLGDLWPPVGKDKTVSVFAPDVCSSLNLVYNGTAEYLGLTGRKYVSDETMLDNGTIVPSRSCYCDDRDCQPSGTFNVSKCKFGAPAFISLPHFYLADESYRSSLEGMKPRKEKHEFSVVVEPMVGIPMKVRGRLQLNLLVQPDKTISLFKNVPRTFVPMLWFTQEADLSDSLAGQVKFILTIPLLGHVTLFGIAAIGFLLLAIGTGLYIKRARRSDDVQNLIPKMEQSQGGRTEE